ncbi:phage replication-related protein YjqB (UPF0714/DUF867 family) [Halopiger aswanensis]|uniref:Phage replication-related protein YjqB (UPF0714/DUF867 family) n=2 Tax=Halopiger aswanensis TaxID=148449 RepID=A0A3R7GUK3_9EURY|nr:phage replication-related protein YjqB (UPF0714/DUF867 family) [Halopiger aswanensis]
MLGLGAGLLGLGAVTAGLRPGAAVTGTGSDQNGDLAAVQQDDTDGCAAMSQWDVSLAETTADWNTRSSASRYCSVPCETTEGTALERGQQIRIAADDASGGFPDAVYTIVSTHEGTAVRLTQGGLERIGASDSAAATLGGRAVHPSYDTRELGRYNDEYVEYLVGEDDETTDVFAMAPHGGFVEYGTDFQAERVANLRGDLAWICAGFNDGGGAYSRWHVPSTEINRRSFPLLDGLSDQPGDWAVSFHGYADETVFVGGTASEADRQLVAEEISARIDGVDVVLASGDATDYDGAAPTNILNESAPVGRTIQIEQPSGVRQRQWRAVADGVVSGLETLLE